MRATTSSRDESHLVVRAMRAAFEAMGEQPTGLRLTCTNRIPHSRGMGSSSAAIVGGIVLARALVDDGTSAARRRAGAARWPTGSRVTPTTSRRHCSVGS